jgi:hypothetical protein
MLDLFRREGIAMDEIDDDDLVYDEDDHSCRCHIHAPCSHCEDCAECAQ